jgi:O-antigen/teichoic acid export membrane protein
MPGRSGRQFDPESENDTNLSGKVHRFLMISTFFNAIYSYFAGLYNHLSQWAFPGAKESRSENIKEFINNLGIVFIYRIIGAVFSTVIAILAAKFLGPARYGQIGLVNNISTILLLPVLFGINSSMYKYLPDCDQSENDRLKAVALSGNTVLIIVFGLFYFNIGHWVEHSFKIPVKIWHLGIIATIVLDLYTLSESFIRGQKKFFLLARLKLVCNTTFFLLFLFFQYYFKMMDVQCYFYIFFGSEVLFFILALYKSDFHSFPLSGPVFKKIYAYSALNMFNSMLLILINSSDLFIINYFFPGREVGIYSIYQGFVKNLFSIMFYEVFAVVFLPTIAKLNKKQLYITIRKLIPALWLMVVVATAAFTVLIVSLSGKEYALNMGYVLLVSSGIGFYTIFHIYNSIFSMEGTRGAKLCLIPLAITLPISLVIQYKFTEYWGITGTMIAVTISNLFLVTIFIATIRRLYHKFNQNHPR